MQKEKLTNKIILSSLRKYYAGKLKAGQEISFDQMSRSISRIQDTLIILENGQRILGYFEYVLEIVIGRIEPVNGYPVPTEQNRNDAVRVLKNYLYQEMHKNDI